MIELAQLFEDKTAKTFAWLPSNHDSLRYLSQVVQTDFLV